MQKFLLKSPYLAGALLATAMLAVILSTGSIAHAETANPPDYADSWFAAARAGRTDILQALIDARFPIESTTAEGYTALTLSAYNHQSAALALLIERGANACTADKRGNTALMGALFKGDADVARTLMATSCDIDQANNAGETAVSFATLFGRLDMLPLLREHGADLNHIDANGRTPLALAIEQHNSSAAQALQQLGAQ
ncbi:ankyrin repeat domain-containing protein [Janthinobacterium agaricidamnosum]|uniref:Ankyrin repeat family protein n=1 Tax=Janthinobacterium agaricidamnosum NBRC 102515 = DSM 9628 TaxID=1349767 RepID=W0V530_9BURK|nr:ankyrin repeat domain-containing protein [Janthinobacterium agaricidamnosum]CDG82725.1 ankyrin repeat family protein [Janthinobacterium agaricidamnosum NBRC 102515 = DSM 9628]